VVGHTESIAPVVVGDGEFAISMDYLVALQEYAAECGMPPQAVLEGSGIPLNALIKSNVRVRNESMDRAVKNVLEHLQDPLLAIKYGRRLTISRHGTLGFALQSCRNLLDACELLLQYVDIRSGGTDHFSFSEEGDVARLEVNILESALSDTVSEFHCLSLLACIEMVARWLGGRSETLINTEVRLTFALPCEIPEHLLFPGQVFVGNQPRNELLFPAEFLLQPLATANPVLFDAAMHECESELLRLSMGTDVTSRVRAIFREHPGRAPTVEQIADALHISSRTLKRRLSDADTSYQKIKDSERFRLAIDLLENTQDNLEQIADTLGYSDASNFTKAFKNWAKMSPREYRNQLNRPATEK